MAEKKERSDVYCGIGIIPKGKRLGTIDECFKKKQIKYYGQIAVDPEILKRGASDLRELRKLEAQKLLKLNTTARVNINNIKKMLIVLSAPTATKSQLKIATQNKAKYIAMNKRLIKSIQDQNKKIIELDMLIDKEDAIKEAAAKKMMEEAKKKKSKKKPVNYMKRIEDTYKLLEKLEKERKRKPVVKKSLVTKKSLSKTGAKGSKSKKR